MKKLTDSQMKSLSRYEQYLRTAHFGNYISGLPSFIANKITDLYNQIFEKNELYSRCNQCHYNMCKELGDLYFSQKGV